MVSWSCIYYIVLYVVSIWFWNSEYPPKLTQQTIVSKIRNACSTSKSSDSIHMYVCTNKNSLIQAFIPKIEVGSFKDPKFCMSKPSFKN